ncbi:MAG: UDP-N-acetylglucosamine--N-acetylmuramyl-(pentapeptide) pyrophosphoryl-undecaprenol N-acetylglucosamine transferase, partial [Candidatus Paceibacterota bacterium]
FFKALSILGQEKPLFVITFGGYVALPISLAAALKRIPFYLHEQTLSPGLANIFLSFLARKVFVTFPETVRRFPLRNGQSLGNPIKNFLQMERQPDWFQESDKPLILILGGSAGSHSINLILEKIIPELSQKYFLIHQTGDSSYRDYDRLVKFKSASSYLPVKFIHPHELHFLFQKANLVITRSGANTFFSLLYFQKPSILIPLPWARNNEQYKQANLLKDLKVAEIFPQTSEATSLIKLVETVFRNEKEYRHHFSQTGSHLNLIVDAKELLAKIHD